MSGTLAASEKSERAFRTISEAAEIIGVPQHVLRFWETRFPQLQPLKRGGNRRYYRPTDMALLETIRAMLHDQGLTIRGAKLILGSGTEAIVAVPAYPPRSPGRRTSDLQAQPDPAAPMPLPRFAFSPNAAGSAASPADTAAPGIDPDRLRSIRDRLRYALAA
ncbi:MAG: MerR family transcriptional regulator [Sandarakinorhabdus sp.]|nr:MerR family transcriptional regulator [Sandarakinorhabdus sp.]